MHDGTQTRTHLSRVLMVGEKLETVQRPLQKKKHYKGGAV